MWNTDLPADGRNIHDSTIALFAHLRKYGQSRVKRSPEKYIERLAIFFCSHGVHWADGNGPRIIHQDIDLTQFVTHIADRFFDLVFIANIARMNKDCSRAG